MSAIVRLTWPIAAAVAERFWAKVDKSGECWEWTAYRMGNGYGQFRVSQPRRMVLAHRLAYELTIGPIPDGLVIDHLCRNRACVNPDHIEAVTTTENNRRLARIFDEDGTCRSGRHQITPEDLYIDPHGARQCRPCATERKRTYRAKRRAVK